MGKRTASMRLVLERFSFIFPRLLARQKLYREKISGLSRLLRSLSPKNVLSRGYSIVRKSGRIIKDAAGLKPGDGIEISLAKGRLEAEVNSIRK